VIEASNTLKILPPAGLGTFDRAPVLSCVPPPRFSDWPPRLPRSSDAPGSKTVLKTVDNHLD
jgi:hypothetical protein